MRLRVVLPLLALAAAVLPAPLGAKSQQTELAGKRRLPTVSGPREFAVDGGLIAYGANYPDLFRRSASYVDKILRGAKPADLPVEQPTTIELVLNLKTARALGLTVPYGLRTRADEQIQ